MKNKTSRAKIVVGVIFIAALALSSWYFWGRRQGSSGNQSGAKAKSSQQATVGEITVGRSFNLPGFDPANSKLPKGQIAMTVVRARKLNQVQVKGEPTDAPKGKMFLALDLELNNTSQEMLGFFARDYFRLIIEDKPYAPQFYNRGVGVAPVSVKNDRVAFLVNNNLKNFTVRVGELSGKKENLSLQFKE